MDRKQRAVETLQEVLKDRDVMESKLLQLVKDRLVGVEVLGIALTRLENLKDDLLNAIDEMEG